MSRTIRGGINIEMQCSDDQSSGLAKRTRYYQAMIDMDMLKKGEVYNQLRPSYIIFICTFDAFDEGLPMYTFRNRCVEKDGLELGDEATKIFLNSKGDSERLGRIYGRSCGTSMEKRRRGRLCRPWIRK